MNTQQLISLCHARVIRDHLSGMQVKPEALDEAARHLHFNGPFPKEVLDALGPTPILSPLQKVSAET